MILQYILIGFAPGLFWMAWLRHKDQLEPEPRLMLLRVFGLGCLSTVPVLLLRGFLEPMVPATDGWSAWIVDAFLVTALLEEGSKFLAVFFGAYFHKELDEPLDGIVYGVAAALGFASVENVIYLIYTDSTMLILQRAFTATLGHIAFTGSLGYFLGRAKFTAHRPVRWIASGFLVALFLHGLYDVFLFANGWVQWVSLVFVLPITLVLFGWKLRWSQSVSHHYHGSSDRL
ncbi:MAG: PrsW family glutamic-type intramembrane protease [Planctomycetota bacterium]